VPGVGVGISPSFGAYPFSWVLQSGGVNANLDLDFVNNRAWNNGGTTIASLLTCTRASTGYYTNANGTLQSFGNNVLRYETGPNGNGLLVEESRTNVVLWNRDLTNVSWTKTNCTAALDQTANDGTVNGASSLLATAGNATCLQAITLGSSARFQSCWIKRITGTGTINMTMDNGATWTAVTVTAGWTSVSIPTQTLANPTVGFQIVTNGDKIAIDFVQNENGAFQTSPIPTTSSSATRAVDSITGSTAGFYNATASTLYTQAMTFVPSSASQQNTFVINDGSAANRFMLYTDGTLHATGLVTTASSNVAVLTDSAVTQSVTYKSAMAAAANNYAEVLNNGAAVTSASGAMPSGITSFYVGADRGSGTQNGYIKRIAYWNTRLSNAALGVLTT